MVHFHSYMSAADCTCYVDVNAPFASVSISTGPDSAKQHQKVEMVDAVLGVAPAKPDVTVIDGFQSSASASGK